MDETTPITYYCPVCKEQKNAIYTYYKPKYMCWECLREEDIIFARKVSESETEWRNWKASQASKNKTRGY